MLPWFSKERHMSARWLIQALGLAVLVLPAAAGAATPDESRVRIAAALDNIAQLERPMELGLATIWDGNKYVQCRRTADHMLVCEAAGDAMQPTLARVLTPERAARLATLGWHLDPSFGNYVQSFPPNMPPRDAAAAVAQALTDGYDADLGAVAVRTSWVAAESCPPRNGAKQNLAGSINDAPSMAGVLIHACHFTPPPAEIAIRSAQDLIGVYGARVTGEVGRIIVNGEEPGIHVVFDTDGGYVQCAPDKPPAAIFCEAASADSMPTLDAVLTPEHVAQLHALGYADPGRSPNYAKSFSAANADAGAIAREVLTTLYDVYGYRGRPKLAILTEKGG